MTSGKICSKFNKSAAGVLPPKAAASAKASWSPKVICLYELFPNLVRDDYDEDCFMKFLFTFHPPPSSSHQSRRKTKFGQKPSLLRQLFHVLFLYSNRLHALYILFWGSILVHLSDLLVVRPLVAGSGTLCSSISMLISLCTRDGWNSAMQKAEQEADTQNLDSKEEKGGQGTLLAGRRYMLRGKPD